MIFYFHGFASSGKSWKAGVLKMHFPDMPILTPTLPIDPAEVVKTFEQVVREKGKPKLIIGSSLGGFYAYYAATIFKIPAVLINPSTTPWVTLAGYVGPNKRYYSGEPFQWKETYLKTLKQLKTDIDNAPSQHHLLNFFLSNDDDILDLSVIPDLFSGAGSIRFFDNCGHSFSRFAEIIPDIKGLLEVESI
jgi:uncharacterized protein